MARLSFPNWLRNAPSQRSAFVHFIPRQFPMTFSSALPVLPNCRCLFIIMCFPETANGGQSVSQARGKWKESLRLAQIPCAQSSLKCNRSEMYQKELGAPLSLDPLRAGWCCPPSVALSTWYWGYVSMCLSLPPDLKPFWWATSSLSFSYYFSYKWSTLHTALKYTLNGENSKLWTWH